MRVRCDRLSDAGPGIGAGVCQPAGWGYLLNVAVRMGACRWFCGCALFEPALIEVVDERLDETDRVGEGSVVDVLWDIGRPVIVGGLLEPRA